MTVKKQLKKKDVRVTAINGSEIVKRKKNTNDKILEGSLTMTANNK